MKENNGWVKLHRKIVDWEWYQDHKTFILFMHLLLTVNYEDKKWQGQVISRGSRITSLDTLCLELNKRPKHPTISIWDIRKSLDKLKSTNELTIKTNNKYTHISVNKYNEYQDDTSKLTNNSQTTHKQLTTTKEYKNIRNKEIYMSGKTYLEIWNKVFNTNYTSSKQTDKPLKEWLTTYSIEQICEAIENIKYDDYWKDKDLDPTWLLRFRDSSGEIDRIGKMLNVKKVTKIVMQRLDTL